MAAHDDATVTIDTNEMTYIDRNGLSHVVTNAETFGLSLAAAAASGERYTSLAGENLTCTDGFQLYVDKYDQFTSFSAGADATAKINAGSVWFREDDGYLAEWKIRTLTIDDIDEPTALTATLERVDSPVHTMTLTTVTVSQ